MSCPTCGHTMASINDVAAFKIFHCPRCGTLKTETYTGDPQNWHVETYVPGMTVNPKPVDPTPDLESLRRAVEFGLTNGKTNIVVSLSTLQTLLAQHNARGYELEMNGFRLADVDRRGT
jgi:hypothetical protein